MRKRKSSASLSTLKFLVGAGFVISLCSAVFSRWWFFDLFSHFRIQYVLAGFLLLPIFLWLKKYTVAAIIFVAIIVHSFALWPYLQSNVPDMDVQADEHVQKGTKIMFANIYYKSANFEVIQNQIKNNSPDIIILAEMNSQNYQTLASKISGVYPYHDYRDGRGAYDISYFSKSAPIAEAMYFSESNPSWLLKYGRDGETFNILGIHPHSPISQKTTQERNEHLAAALAYASDMDGQVLVIGDFNISQFSSTFQHLIKENNLIDTQLEFGLQPSWHAQLPSMFRIPIDQVLVNDKVEVLDRYVGETTGSDHFPVFVEVE